MTTNTDAGHASRTRPAMAVAVTHALPWLALASLFALALLLRHVLAANTDVSWLLTAGERVLAGQRLYVDVIETNPPMAVLAYLPGIAIARLLGIAAETAVDALVFAGIFAALALSTRILARASVVRPGQGWPLALLAVAMLAVLPAQSFGQREHIALIAMLPMLAVMVVRVESRRPSLAEAIAAGLGAAVALSFKPHFAIALVAALVVVMMTRRSLRVLLCAEVVTAAAAMTLYAAAVIVLFPEFLTVIAPMVRDVYLPVHLSWPALLVKPAMWLWVAAVLVAALQRSTSQPSSPRKRGPSPHKLSMANVGDYWVARSSRALTLRDEAENRAGLDALLQVLLATSFGFAMVFLLQRKGWPYHSYPMLALAMLGCGWALVTHAPKSAVDRALGIGGVIVLVALLARSMLWFDTAFDARPLQDRVARLGLMHPAVLAITAEPGIGHPLVRAVGGTWVSRQQALWVATYLDVMRGEGPVAPALEAYATRECAMLREDIRRTPPDVVLVDDLTGNATAWLAAHPDVAGVLRGFHLADSVNQVGIWTR